MESEISVREWYNSVGEKCLNFYKKSNKNEKIILRELIKRLPKDSLILDVGCGTGRPAKFLAKKGYKLICIDISEKMLKAAQKNVPNAKFKKMSMYNMKFKDKSFEGAIAFFSFLHLEKKKIKKIFKDLNKFLKKDGYLVFSVNKGVGEGYFEYFGEKVYVSEYTKKELTELIKNTGFKTILQKDFLVPGLKGKDITIY